MSQVPFWNMGLTPQMVRTAEEELRETPQKRKEALKEFKRLIQDESGFAPYTDDLFLMRFLRVKKFDVKRAFKTFMNYYSYKAKNSGHITDLCPSDIKHILEMDKMLISPKRDVGGGAIFIIRAGSYDLQASTPEDLLSAAVVCAEIALEFEASQVCGNVAVLDLKGMTLSKVGQFCSPNMLSLFIRGIQECWPYRVKAFHIVNEPSYFSFTYTVIKPMITKKLRDRIHFHGSNLKSLHKCISLESLTTELGGYLGDKDFLDFRSNVMARQPLMEKINKYVYHKDF